MNIINVDYNFNFDNNQEQRGQIPQLPEFIWVYSSLNGQGVIDIGDKRLTINLASGRMMLRFNRGRNKIVMLPK